MLTHSLCGIAGPGRVPEGAGEADEESGKSATRFSSPLEASFAEGLPARAPPGLLLNTRI